MEFNGVRTEDIARHSGISKRTLYAHFKSKELIVQDVILFQIDLVRSQSDRIQTEHPSAIEEFAALWNYASGVIHAGNPNFLRDLSRQYSQAWNVLTQFKSEFRMDFLVANLRKGIAQQVYRQDMDLEVISLIWLEVMGSTLKKLNPGPKSELIFARVTYGKGVGLINHQGCKAT